MVIHRGVPSTGAKAGIDGGGVLTFLPSPPLLLHLLPLAPLPLPCHSPDSLSLPTSSAPSPSLLPRLFPSPPLKSRPLKQLGDLGEPRPKSNFVHSTAVRKPLVAIILSILKCMFYSTSITICNRPQLRGGGYLTPPSPLPAYAPGKSVFLLFLWYFLSKL